MNGHVYGKKELIWKNNKIRIDADKLQNDYNIVEIFFVSFFDNEHIKERLIKQKANLTKKHYSFILNPFDIDCYTKLPMFLTNGIWSDLKMELNVKNHWDFDFQECFKVEKIESKNDFYTEFIDGCINNVLIYLLKRFNEDDKGLDGKLEEGSFIKKYKISYHNQNFNIIDFNFLGILGVKEDEIESNNTNGMVFRC